MKTIILENIRSAYNVWNVIRTADALGWNVRLVGYTPSPIDNPKVRKTSLGAENHVWLKQFNFTNEALQEAKKIWLLTIWAELTPNSIDLDKFSLTRHSERNPDLSGWSEESLSSSEEINGFPWQKEGFAIVFWNEVDWVLPSTLDSLDHIVQIPMNWTKESLNIWQSAAIFMREFTRSSEAIHN